MPSRRKGDRARVNDLPRALVRIELDWHWLTESSREVASSKRNNVTIAGRLHDAIAEAADDQSGAESDSANRPFQACASVKAGRRHGTDSQGAAARIGERRGQQ